jgi:hypothetical protein
MVGGLAQTAILPKGRVCRWNNNMAAKRLDDLEM